MADDCNRASCDVDHIKAVDGPNDPLFWETLNHQALCHSCHSRKTSRGRGRAISRDEAPQTVPAVHAKTQGY